MNGTSKRPKSTRSKIKTSRNKGDGVTNRIRSKQIRGSRQKQLMNPDHRYREPKPRIHSAATTSGRPSNARLITSRTNDLISPRDTVYHPKAG